MEKTHIVARFDKKLDQIRDQILEMGDLAGTQISDACELLDTFDPPKAEHLIATDLRINGMNKDIHKWSERLIALRQPVALDLRQALLPINIAAELERIGDHAKSAAKTARSFTHPMPTQTTMPILHKMSGLVQEMLGDVLLAYKDSNIELAAEIRVRDQEVDTLNTALFEEAIEAIGQAPQEARHHVQLVLLARNFERVGDHVVNIARHVHHIVTGEDLKASQ